MCTLVQRMKICAEMFIMLGPNTKQKEIIQCSQNKRKLFNAHKTIKIKFWWTI